MMKERLPRGWNEKSIREIIDHYEKQTENEAVAEDEAAFSQEGYAIVPIPHEILPEVMLLLQDYEAKRNRKATKK